MNDELDNDLNPLPYMTSEELEQIGEPERREPTVEELLKMRERIDQALDDQSGAKAQREFEKKVSKMGLTELYQEFDI